MSLKPPHTFYKQFYFKTSIVLANTQHDACSINNNSIFKNIG